MSLAGLLINKKNVEGIYSSGFFKQSVHGFLVFVLFISWLSYPLGFGLVYPVLFKGIMIILLGLLLLFILSSMVPARQMDFLLKPQWLIPLVLYLIYWVCYFLATLMNFTVGSCIALLASYGEILFAFIILLFLPWWINILAFDIYTKVIVILTVLSIFLFWLLANDLISPLNTITIHVGSKVYEFDNYGLGFARSHYFIDFSGYRIARMQSFADEPGSFAHALLPAIFWALLNKKKLMVIILSLGLLLTMALGAILALGIVGFLYCYKEGSRTILKALFSFILIVALLIAITPTEFSESVAWYLKTKYDPEQRWTTSGEARQVDSKVTFQLLNEKPWGFGAKQANKAAGRDIAVGWCVALLDAGLLGGSAYFLAFSWLFLLAIIIFLKEKNKIKLYICANYITTYIMTSQRAKMDDSFWLLWIVVSFIMIEGYPKEYPTSLTKSNSLPKMGIS